MDILIEVPVVEERPPTSSHGRSQLKILQLGVIGYGYWGPHLVRNLSALSDGLVTYIADLDTERLAQAQAQYRHIRVTRDALDLYESDIDAVFEEFQLSYHTGEIIIPPLQWQEPLQAACEHLARCIRSGQQPLSNGIWSLPVTKTLAAIQRSLDLEGQEVPL
ncbi:MAG TPA: hypothetical protein VH593_31515 [Ktedonobacteraceae bacterium]|jgi:predicted dehydrogenase